MHRKDRAEEVGDHRERGKPRPQAENERDPADDLPCDDKIAERRGQTERSEEMRGSGGGEDESFTLAWMRKSAPSTRRSPKTAYGAVRRSIIGFFSTR